MSECVCVCEDGREDEKKMASRSTISPVSQLHQKDVHVKQIQQSRQSNLGQLTLSTL